MAGIVTRSSDLALDVGRLQEEHKKVVKGCEGQIEHWQKVEKDYDSLRERLKTPPDQLSYDIMVPFGPLAFMPGKLVHTNEVTALLGDNWFAKCSAKQAQDLVEHRKKHVKHTLDDLHKVRKNFENRASFTNDLERLSGGKGDYVDIREEVVDEETLTKGKRRVAHKPHSKPKIDHVVTLEEEGEEEEEEGEEEHRVGTGGCVSGDGGSMNILSKEELWARLDALEAQEEQQDERDRMCDSTDTNGEDTSSSSEEEKEREVTGEANGSPAEECTTTTTSDTHISHVNGVAHTHHEDEGEDEEEEGEDDPNALPTIYFSHTVEPKKVRINTGKNTMLKFSERKEQKEQAKKKKKNGKTNNHSRHEHHKITSPVDIYRLFVDVVNGELIPRKSILKSRSRENSVCSDTSESSTADFEERRSALGRTFSHDDATHSDTSDCVTEEDSPPGIPLHPGSRFEAFSGTVVEKDPLPSSIPHLTIAPPALPTILERKSEELCTETPQEQPKRVSKFKAARLQQK